MKNLKVLLSSGKIVKQKHKKDKNNDVDTYYEDPLLLIEWDTMGIVARAIANPANTNLIISNCMYKS